MAALRLAADVGGTFTDVLVTDGESLRALKVSSTPPHFGEAVIRSVVRFRDDGVDVEGLEAVLHGTTVATNAILERRGVTTALVTTAGFRDVLAIGRGRRPSTFDLRWQKPEPLVPRHLRLEVGERMDAHGRVLAPVDREDLARVAAAIRAADVQSVAVCLLNSYVNSQHERQVAEALAGFLPDVSVSASCDLVAEIREYERTSTTVINAYLRPVVEGYVEQLQAGLAAQGVEPRVEIMQSNGGLTHSERAKAQPVRIVESGPAAGVIAAAQLAELLGLPDVVSFDMGGTTAKASLVENGRPTEVSEFEVGEGMNSSRLVSGRGHPIKIPSLDIVEVGAGGGSIFWLDAIGEPHLGPQSAGATPGPVCYGLGGAAVTVSDANLVLGYLDPTELAGGTQVLDGDAALKVLADDVAAPLGLSLLDAAYGVHTLANTNMGRALRAVSIERGRDPREHVLVAFGGSGPMHAASMALDFGIPRVIVPACAGLFSALGLLTCEARQDFARPYPGRADIDVVRVRALFDDLCAHALEEMAVERASPVSVLLHRSCDLRYAGQHSELRISLPDGHVDARMLRGACEEFHREHLRTFGHNDIGRPVELVALRVAARRPTTASALSCFELAGRAPAQRGPAAERKAYFGREHGLLATPVIGRWELDARPTPGPLIVQDMDATTVVPPGCAASRDEIGDIVIDVGVA